MIRATFNTPVDHACPCRPRAGVPLILSRVSNSHLPAGPGFRRMHSAHTQTVTAHPAAILWGDPRHFATSCPPAPQAWPAADALDAALAQGIAGEPIPAPRPQAQVAKTIPGHRLKIPQAYQRKTLGYFQHVAVKFLLDRKARVRWNGNIEGALRKQGINTRIRNIAHYFLRCTGITPSGEQLLRRADSASRHLLTGSDFHGSNIEAEHAYLHSNAGRHNLRVIDAQYRDLHQKGLLAIDRYPSAVLWEAVAAHCAGPVSSISPECR